MNASDVNWTIQERGIAVLETASELFGEARFANGSMDRRLRPPTLHLFAVQPAEHEIARLDQLAEQAGWAFTLPPVRRSYAELTSFMESLSGEGFPGEDVCVAFGPDVSANAIRFTLRRLDSEVIDHVLARVPADAVVFDIQPRAGGFVAL